MTMLLPATSLWVAAGGAIGSVGRFWLSLVAVRLWGDQFPWGTLIINIGGSFVIGLFGNLTARDGALPAGADLRAFVMIGLCGGFTTFSSFSLQSVELLRAGYAGRAAGNVVASVLLCLLATTVGLRLSQH